MTSSAPRLRLIQVRPVVPALAIALAIAGCGGGGSSGAPPGATKKLPHVSAGPRQLKIERDHLALVAQGLRGAETSIHQAVLAARAAWPAIAEGLPARVSPASQILIARALAGTQRIATPHFISYAGELTGAGAAIAGLELSFEQLSQRGWTMTLAAAQHLGPGARRTLSPTALRFIRANASLYIGSVYDGNYNLSVIGERLREAYAQLGGASAFGAALTPALVRQLAGFYSPAVVRLAPKPPA